MKRRLSAASILLGLALLSVAADGVCTLAGLGPMTMAIAGALPDTGADPMLVMALGALCAACRLAVLLFAPAFVIAAALLMAYDAVKVGLASFVIRSRGKSRSSGATTRARS